jgi:hypothetical protein
MTVFLGLITGKPPTDPNCDAAAGLGTSGWADPAHGWRARSVHSSAILLLPLLYIGAKIMA